MGYDGEGSVAADDNDGNAASKRSPAPPPPEDVDSDKTIQKPVQAAAELDPKPESNASSRRALSSPATGEEYRPPLPPRPTNLSLLQEGKHNPGDSLQLPKRSARPQLQSTATTAISRTDIHTQSYQDGSRATTASDAQTTRPSKHLGGFSSIRRFKNFGSSEADSASVKSCAPTLEAGGDVESLLGEVLGSSQESPAWKLLSAQIEAQDPFDSISNFDDGVSADFYREFDAIGEVDPDGENEGRNAMLLSKPTIFADAIP